MKYDDYIIIIWWRNYKEREMIMVGWTYFILKVP
jgi:hypothetical protein